MLSTRAPTRSRGLDPRRRRARRWWRRSRARVSGSGSCGGWPERSQNDSSPDRDCDTAAVDTVTGRQRFPLPVVEAVRSRVDAVLATELRARRAELEALDPSAGILVEELERLVGAGGKRLRPAFCYLGYRAAGGRDGEPVVRAAAALELLHTFALVHDDVMDEAVERRGVETTQVRFARSFAGSSV